MASIPPDVVRSRSLIEGAGDERTAISRLSDRELFEYILNPKGSTFNPALLAAEHKLRLSKPSYAKMIQDGFTRSELDQKRYDAFAVDAFHSVPLPKGGFFSKWVDRSRGDQCVKIIDKNENRKPDDGDTCVGRNGAHYPNASFTGDPVVATYAGKTCGNLAQFRRFSDCAASYSSGDDHFAHKRSGTEFEVHRPGGAEQLSMSLADESAAYGGKVSDQAVETVAAVGLTAEEHPVATGAALTVVGGLLAHPVTRGPTSAVLGWLGTGSAAAGTSYLVYDRATGLSQLVEDGDLERYQETTGNHDFLALTAMAGGAATVRGVAVGDAARKVFYAPGAALDYAVKGCQQLVAGGARLLEGAGGGPQLALVGGGTMGSGAAIEAEAALVATGAVTTDASALVGPTAMAMGMRGGYDRYQEPPIRVSKRARGRSPDKSRGPRREPMGGNGKENEQVRSVVARIRDRLLIGGKRLKEIKRRIHDALGVDKSLGKTELVVETAAGEKGISYPRVEAAARQVLDEMGIVDPF